MKTLGIYYATACYRDEQGRYYTSNGLGRYLQVMHQQYPFRILLAAPTTTEPLPHLGYPLPADRLSVYELPYFETFVGALKVRARLVPRLRRLLQQQTVDVLWLRYPGAYGTTLWKQAVAHRTPVFFELVGDPLELLQSSPYLRPWRRWVMVCVARQHERTLRYMLRHTPAFAVSGKLAHRFARGGAPLPVITASTLMPEDLAPREDTCQDAPYRLLFVGALRHEKGVETIIRATEILQRQDVPVQLHLVGDGPLRLALEQEARLRLQPQSYCFHGFQTDPAVLHQFYTQADVFVLGSTSEALGRVILEAMARGAPVVATAVGGVPHLVTDGVNGLLIPPQNPKAMAEAVLRVIENPPLRRRLIAEGHRTAEEHTTARFLQKVMLFIAEQTGVNLLEGEGGA
jgi:glycosyltransferase involved in cell wall biosynthesis